MQYFSKYIHAFLRSVAGSATYTQMLVIYDLKKKLIALKY